MKNSASTMQRMVTILCCSIIFFAANTSSINAQESAQPIEGRWDITFNMDGKATPAWMEVRHSGVKTLVGDVMVAGGSARPISKVNFGDGKFSFSVPPQWEKGDGDLTIDGALQNDHIAGTITYPDGKTYKFTGVRAPALIRTAEPEWGAPIQLFNGKNLQGWHASGETNQWVAEDGVLRSPKSGSNIISDAMFTDFKLHVEFRYPEHSNSGVYLRGRYEVQVMDSKGMAPAVGLLGAVYGLIVPSKMVAKAPGEWQSYDITLVGRMVTVVANGETIICNREIAGITGGALNSNEGEPGPIYFQGDHGPIEYRNIVITPAK